MRFAVGALLCAPAALFAQKFEGAITIAMTSQQGRMEMTYLVKGDQARVDMPARGGMSGYMIHDGGKKTNLMVMPEQRMYMDMAAMQGMPGMAPPAPSKAPDIKATGRKETIAGYECEHIIVTGDDGQFDVCAAKGLGSFMRAQPPGGRGRGAGGPPPGLDRLGADFFPLKVQKVGGEASLEVTKIDKKSLDASMFAIPDGFQKMDMGSMMRRPPA